MTYNQQSYHKVHFIQRPDRDVVWEEIARYIQRYIPINSSVLELGAGYCNFINTIKAKSKTAIDIWSGFKSFANPSVRTFSMDLSKGKVNLKEKFDTVFASNFLEHLSFESSRKMVSEIHRLLLPNGKVIIIQPNFRDAYRYYFDDYTHQSVFSHVSLTRLLTEKGFNVQTMQARFTPYTLNSKFPKNRFLTRLYLNLPIKPFGGQMLIVAVRS